MTRARQARRPSPVWPPMRRAGLAAGTGLAAGDAAAGEASGVDPPPPCDTTLSIAFACSIHPVTVASDGMRRIQFGRAASSSWNVVARLAGLRRASSAGKSTPAASSRSAYSDPTPSIRIRSAWLTHSRMSLPEIPVADSISARPRVVAPRARSWSVLVIPASSSFAAFSGPMPSISTMFTPTSNASRESRRRGAPRRVAGSLLPALRLGGQSQQLRVMRGRRGDHAERPGRSIDVEPWPAGHVGDDRAGTLGDQSGGGHVPG